MNLRRWAVIENAGYERELVRREFTSSTQAWDYVQKTYDPDEREAIHVDVAQWDAEGEFWSYDH